MGAVLPCLRLILTGKGMGPSAFAIASLLGKKEVCFNVKRTSLELIVDHKFPSQRWINKETANIIFKKIEPFAEYGFNKSHATAYAMIAYQTAYLKT